jgi:hypothetical protein
MLETLCLPDVLLLMLALLEHKNRSRNIRYRGLESLVPFASIAWYSLLLCQCHFMYRHRYQRCSSTLHCTIFSTYDRNIGTVGRTCRYFVPKVRSTSTLVAECFCTSHSTGRIGSQRFLTIFVFFNFREKKVKTSFVYFFDIRSIW